MEDYAKQNKIAWEFDAYNFWTWHVGPPAKQAKEVLDNPRRQLKKYGKYFDDVSGLKIAVICGSCGKKAIPLAVLGAEVRKSAVPFRNAEFGCIL